MSPLKKGVLVAVVLGALGVASWVLFGDAIKRETDTGAGSYSLLSKFEKEGVPDFEAVKVGGGTERLQYFKGKVVILSFWASWCASCIEEFPSLIQLAKTFKGEVVVVGVSADQTQSDVERFMEIQKAKTPEFVSLWDPSLRVAQTYGTEKIPENYIIGRDMKLVKKLVNAVDWMSPEMQGLIGNLVENKK